MSPLIIYIVVFSGVAALVGGVGFFLKASTETGVEDRLAMLTGSSTGKQAKEALLKGSVLAQPLESSQHLIWEYLSHLGNLNLLFEQADTSITAPQFFGISAIMAIVGMFIPVFAGMHPGLVLPMGISLAVLPWLWLLLRRRKRFRQFARQLPEALELVSRALRAGHSLASGFNLVSEEMHEPISKEFQRVFEENNLGIPLDTALDNMTNRIPNLDLRFFATAIILQRQTGGDLAEILDKIGYIVRERFKIWGQVQALTGEGRLSGIVLLALPPALFAAVYRMNPEYETPLFTDPLGRKMLAVGIVMQLLGAIVVKKIINIKV
ncbi:MAG: type II secretion system F family protein [Planctomycetia bacterium]|nr:type II secretion system F family protein [Planctomycetia bacterium]